MGQQDVDWHLLNDVNYKATLPSNTRVVAGQQGGGNSLPPEISKNVLLVAKFSSKSTTFWARNPPFWGNLGAQLV